MLVRLVLASPRLPLASQRKRMQHSTVNQLLIIKYIKTIALVFSIVMRQMFLPLKDIFHIYQFGYFLYCNISHYLTQLPIQKPHYWYKEIRDDNKKRKLWSFLNIHISQKCTILKIIRQRTEIIFLSIYIFFGYLFRHFFPHIGSQKCYASYYRVFPCTKSRNRDNPNFSLFRTCGCFRLKICTCD